jgi:hypothetical protein
MKALVIFISITISFSATAAFSLYHPKADAKEEIVLAAAKAQNKQVLIQANYIVHHLNYSQENIKADIFKAYWFPNRFGFQVFLIVNAAGNLLHTQNSSYLEQGKSYHALKVKECLLSFTNKAHQASAHPNLYQ